MRPMLAWNPLRDGQLCPFKTRRRPTTQRLCWRDERITQNFVRLAWHQCAVFLTAAGGRGGISPAGNCHPWMQRANGAGR